MYVVNDSILREISYWDSLAKHRANPAIAELCKARMFASPCTSTWPGSGWATSDGSSTAWSTAVRQGHQAGRQQEHQAGGQQAGGQQGHQSVSSVSLEMAGETALPAAEAFLARLL
jgi:hypothetical protein